MREESREKERNTRQSRGKVYEEISRLIVYVNKTINIKINGESVNAEETLFSKKERGNT